MLFRAHKFALCIFALLVSPLSANDDLFIGAKNKASASCAERLVLQSLQSSLEQFQSSLADLEPELRALKSTLENQLPNNIQTVHYFLARIAYRNAGLIGSAMKMSEIATSEDPDGETGLGYSEAFHDIGNLLSITASLPGGFSQLESLDPREMAEGVEAAIEGLVAARKIVEGLLSADPLPLRRKTVSARRLFRDIKKLLSIPGHPEIEWSADISLPSMNADPIALSRALLNLCTNAKHAIKHDRGKITLSAELVSSDSLNSMGQALNDNASPIDQYIVLSVKDNGVGIAPDVLPKVFGAGFTTRPEQNGRGLGLSSTLHIVSEHDGLVAVTSELGEGTTFKIFMPAAESPPLVETIPALASGTILLVDDDRITHLVMNRTLTGRSVYSASSGNAAVQVLQANSAQVSHIFLDKNMPGLTLRETVEEIRAINPTVLIHVLTADSNLNSFPGTNRVLHKPIDMAIILPLVEPATEGEQP